MGRSHRSVGEQPLAHRLGRHELRCSRHDQPRLSGRWLCRRPRHLDAPHRELLFFESLSADFDGNGKVGGSDFVLLFAGYGIPGGTGDADGDGIVGGPDFVALATQFGQTAQSFSVVGAVTRALRSLPTGFPRQDLAGMCPGGRRGCCRAIGNSILRVGFQRAPVRLAVGPPQLRAAGRERQGARPPRDPRNRQGREEDPIMSEALREEVAEQARLCTELVNEVGKVLVGQEAMVSRLLVGLLTGGHVLLEGVPGLAKTLTVRLLAEAIDTGFSRIQFTPDMLPADVIGTEIFNPREGTYSVKKGPIFSNLILADEINRAPAKVQAALLEAMQERQATIGDQSYPLAEPFLVLATQNPIEQEGTYPLPEAQVDRFMLKVKVGYPSRDEERKIVDRMASGQAEPEVRHVTGPDAILAARGVVDQVFVDEKVRNYVVDLVHATRDPADSGIAELDGMIETGASPRASIYLTKAAKAHAFLQGRGYATPHDVKIVAPDVLRHRVVLTYEAEAEGKTPEEVIERILVGILVP